MTAVAAPPNIHTRPWSSGQHGLDSMNSDYMQHSRGKPQRWSGSASTPSGAENSGVNGWSNSLGGAKKKGPTRLSGANGGGTLGNGLGGWPKPETGFVRASAGSNGATAQTQPINGSQQNGSAHPQAFLMLLPLNGTFDRKQIPLPYYPETLRIGRQTNAKTIPSPTNGYFDSKVLSRQHAEVWAEKGTGKVWIRDIKSSNGTFVNGQRLSPENQDSDAQELKAKDILELGIDIVGEDNKTIVHHKVAARVEHAGIPGAGVDYDQQLMFGEVDVNGSFGAPSPVSQNNIRGRQGPAGPRSAGPSAPIPIAHRQIMMPSITMEMIVKKLNTELQSAKQQSKDLRKTSELLDVFLAAASVKSLSESLDSEDGASLNQQPPQTNGTASAPSKPSGSVLSQPPVTGLSGIDTSDASGSESVKPGNTDKSDQLDPPHQLLSLVDALAQAKKEMELKSSRVQDLEEALRKERRAREEAEDRATQLENASKALKNKTQDTEHTGGASENEQWPDNVSIAESDAETIIASSEPVPSSADIESITQAATEAAHLHQQRMEDMMEQLQQAKEKMEQYRVRAERAERERDADRKTLNEMIQSIRKDEEKRRKRSASHSSQTDQTVTESAGVQVGYAEENVQVVKSNGAVVAPQQGYKKPNGALSVTPKPPKYSAVESTLIVPRSDSAPYMTMVGVMVLGLTIMAAVNRWPTTSER